MPASPEESPGAVAGDEVGAPIESHRPGEDPQPKPIPAGAVDAQWTRYFELIGGGSRKFWEITLAGDRYSVRFGRLGTEGQERIKTYASPELAEEQALEILHQKVAKGYEEKPR